MIDTHCHLNDESYNKDIDLVVKEALDAGVELIIVPATKKDDFARTIEIAEYYPNVYCAIGVHPHYSVNFDANVYSEMEKLTNHPKVVAIGEVGLDYHYNYSNKKRQLVAFEKQLELAQKLSLPVIIHSRESDTDTLSILKKYFSKDSEIQGVLHCYSCDAEILDDLLSLGLYFSFTANITFNNRQEFYNEIIEQIPLDKIMLETDSPYMTPAPNRGKRNHPQSVKIVAEKISQIKNINIEEVLTMTTKNAKRFFNIPKIISLFILVFLSSAYFSLAQEYIDEEGYYYEDEYDIPDYYNRVLGIGPMFGTNTIVDRYTTDPKSFSNEGILSFGGVLNYRFLENFILQGAFTYSKNMYYVNKMPEALKDALDPNYHKAIELSFIAMAKPRNMVNFYASVGGTYFMNELSRIKNDGIDKYWKEYEYENILGMNAGVGGFVNISLGSGGTLTFYAEWKLNFTLADTKLDYDPRIIPGTTGYNTPTKHSSMYSIPRGGVIWYVPWLKN